MGGLEKVGELSRSLSLSLLSLCYSLLFFLCTFVCFLVLFVHSQERTPLVEDRIISTLLLFSDFLFVRLLLLLYCFPPPNIVLTLRSNHHQEGCSMFCYFSLLSVGLFQPSPTLDTSVPDTTCFTAIPHPRQG